MKRTFQPHRKSRMRTHGFRKRMKTRAGREIIRRRRRKGRQQLTVSWRRSRRGGLSDARPRGPASTQRQRFPRAARVRKRSDYLAIQNRGRRVAGPNLLLFGHPGGRDVSASP